MQEPLDQLRRYGEDLAAAVPPARSRLAALRAVGGSPRPVRRLPRVAAATVGFFAIANVAAAAVSNSAVPGDTLYPLDRAYETVGSLIGLDHSAERLEEAEVLIERSDLDGAMDLVVEAMPDADLEGVTAQLRQGATGEEVRRLVDSARGLGQAMSEGNTEAAAESRAALRLLGAQVSEREQGATPASPASPASPAEPGNPGEPAQPATPADPATPAQPDNQGQGNEGNQGQGNEGNQGQGNEDNQGQKDEDNSGSSGSSGNPGNPGNPGSSGEQGNQGKGQGSGGRP